MQSVIYIQNFYHKRRKQLGIYYKINERKCSKLIRFFISVKKDIDYYLEQINITNLSKTALKPVF